MTGEGAGYAAGEAARSPIRVLLVDDHEPIRTALRFVLDSADDIEVVGEAADGGVAVTNARSLRPDVVLMDVRMPGVDGIEATREIVRDGLADVLVLTTFDLDEYVFGALRAGAAGFLLKTAEPVEILAAVRRVASGDGVVAPEVTQRVIAHFASPAAGTATDGTTGDGAIADGSVPNRAAASGAVPSGALPKAAAQPSVAARLADLTARERDVLAAIAAGLSNQDIAATLVISEATAKTHVSRILTKLGCSSRVQAAILAREAGIV
ncbi:response regulator [Phytoactinopolyspora halotolerans]|uniref:response regulator n=1 Tax=Phytoactinopolyspora halotolerans TaxID=1981512 RepID=UPI00406BD381